MAKDEKWTTGRWGELPKRDVSEHQRELFSENKEVWRHLELKVHPGPLDDDWWWVCVKCDKGTDAAEMLLELREPRYRGAVWIEQRGELGHSDGLWSNRGQEEIGGLRFPGCPLPEARRIRGIMSGDARRMMRFTFELRRDAQLFKLQADRDLLRTSSNEWLEEITKIEAEHRRLEEEHRVTQAIWLATGSLQQLHDVTRRLRAEMDRIEAPIAEFNRAFWTLPRHDGEVSG